MAKKPAAKIGDRVMLPLRFDGVPHRHGNDAVWEVIQICETMPNLVTLALVGGQKGDTCGAMFSACRKI